MIDQANVSTIPISRADSEMNDVKVNFIAAGAFAYLAKQNKLQVHAISLRDVNLSINSLRTKKEWKSLIHNESDELVDLFSEKGVEKLPPHMAYD